MLTRIYSQLLSPLIKMDIRPRNLSAFLAATENLGSLETIGSPFVNVLLPRTEFRKVLSFCTFEDINTLQSVGEQSKLPYLSHVCRSKVIRLGNELVQASIWNDFRKVDRLLQRKVPVSLVVGNGEHGYLTALSGAAMRGNHHIVARLLEAGADVNWTDEMGATALEMAMVRQRYRTDLERLDALSGLGKTIQILKQNGGRKTILPDT